jgi:glutamine synthetase type III
MLPQMKKLRQCADALEASLPKRVIPYPTYEQLLFSE